MKTFKEFLVEHSITLFEGGNLVIGGQAADPIKITPETRETTANDIHGMLSSLHDSFKEEHGANLFGAGKKALKTGSAYSGSTSHLMNPEISHEEFAKVKPTCGDVDCKVSSEHFDKLHAHLSPGKHFGKYIVVGTKKSGGEIHGIFKHDNGSHTQFDFEKSNYEHDEPSKFDILSHSSDWEDAKMGIKGSHSRQLLNAVGTDKHKFSILHGLHSREPDKVKAAAEPWESNPKKISSTLFGPDADHEKLGSVHGLTELIKKHIPKEIHQKIYSKFKKDVVSNRGINNEPALNYLRKHLNVTDE